MVNVAHYSADHVHQVHHHLTAPLSSSSGKSASLWSLPGIQVNSSSHCSSGSDLDLLLRRPIRHKRLRTSFKHHELRVMKSYFALNHNPDAKDLKQLSIKTGLSKRVLQVLVSILLLSAVNNKKAQLTLSNPRDVKACQNCSNSTCFVSFHRIAFPQIANA